MKFTTGLISVLNLAAAVLGSSVVELTEKNFQSVVVDSKIPTIVDVYASWCGHCKRLAPVYDELADAFAHAKGKVQVVKIDGDIHRKISKKYDITGYPSIKFFSPDGSIEEVQVGRDFESLANYITTKTGVKRKAPPPPAVQPLTDYNFDELVGDKNKVAIVAFTASWCGHCKNLKPVYKDLANVYRHDDNVIIGEVDTTGGESAKLQERFQVKSYPTILVFPYGEIPENVEDIETYQGPRTVEAFTDYVNSLSGVNRAPDGSLNQFAGRFSTLDKFAKLFVEAPLEGKISLRERIVKFMTDAHIKGEAAAEAAAKQYLKIAEKIEESEAYLDKEIKRLGNIISRGSLKKTKSDELTKKLNILKIFVPGAEPEEETVKAEKKANDEL